MPPKHSSGTHYGGGGGGATRDLSGVEKKAKHHAGHAAKDTDEDRGIFSSAVSMISQKSGQLQDEDVDEDSMVDAHKSFFGSGGKQQWGSYIRWHGCGGGNAGFEDVQFGWFI